MMDPAVSIKQLSHAFGRQEVLKSISLNLDQGRYFAIAGVNGAGKSTLIKLMLDLIRPLATAEIRLFGKSNQAPECRAQVAYLPESFTLKKPVSGWQYLQFVASIYRVNIDWETISELALQFDFPANRLRSRVSEYSKGMTQKLGLISCFMLDRKLLILDEPLSGLDPKARYHFKEYLKNVRSDDRTLFYSTHMLSDAEEICDQFGILHDGEIRFIGTPASCLEQYQADTLEKAYMNCITQAPAQ
jgi:ABC-2 type transport system ATP-binding protein